MFGRIAAILMSILVLAASVRADTNIDLSLEPSSGTVNDVFALDVNVSGDEARALEGPFFDESAEFRIDPAGTSSSLSIVNGLQQFTLTYSFRLYADPNLPLGKHPIPKGRFRYGRETVLL
ncbi:MAG: hypothetical protein IT290_03195, partial [Deltaproteobacteria bacterium]|nr:hypothetical protein [Deltaproteobacteria bacterium]